ncbi:MAG TPA: amidohydrolase family protein [Thermomicrobiales bacterium]|nr:amidohydrolase family protein [Thermomicrobiales bacterium]
MGAAPRIIDAHTHIFPPDVVARRDAYRARDPWFAQLYENPRAALASPDDLLASMDRAGIERSIACGFPWADPGVCREHNEWLAEVRATWPERIDFLAIVVPQSASAVADAERAFAVGAAGIGELNADAQHFDLRHPATVTDLMVYCREMDKPVMLHASEPLGHPYPGKGHSTPEALYTWLTAFPDQPVVLAHWGGGLPFFELLPEVHAVTRHVAYDSAATTFLYRPEVFGAVLAITGPERVLFATDYPVLRQDRLAASVSKLIADTFARERVLCGNAESIYVARRATV